MRVGKLGVINETKGQARTFEELMYELECDSIQRLQYLLDTTIN